MNYYPQHNIDDLLELDKGNQVSLLVLYCIYIIRLPIYGLYKVHLAIWKAMRGALRVKLNRTDEQKD